MNAVSFELIMKTLNRTVEIVAVVLFGVMMYLVFTS